MENFNPTYKINFKQNNCELELTISINYITGICNDKYDLSYKWNVITGNTNIHKNYANPFLNMYYDYDPSDLKGVVVIKNELSTQLIKHLIMSDNQITKICGIGTPCDYRNRIINSLSLFWE